MSSPVAPSLLSSADFDPKAIAQLIDLGITPQLAQLALEKSKGNVAVAADLALSGKVDDEVSKRAWWKNNKSKPPLPPSSFRSSHASTSTASPMRRSSSSSDNGDGGASSHAIRRGSSQEASSSSRIPEGVAVIPPPPPPRQEESAVADEVSDDEDDWVDGGKHSETSATTLPGPPSPPPPIRPATLGTLPSFSSDEGPSSPTSPSESTLTSTASRSRRWSEKLTPSHSSTKGRPPPSGATSPNSSSRPLAHTVLRSLPLGSMVTLGDTHHKKDEPKVARKLNDEASKHNDEAASIVAGLFARNDTSTSSLVPPSSSSSSVSNEPSSKPRLSLFGRRSDKHTSPHPSITSNPPTTNLVPPTPIERATDSASSATSATDDGRGRSNVSRLNTRSMSPFFRSGRSRSRARSPSPVHVGPLRGTTSEAADTDSDDDDTKSESEAGGSGGGRDYEGSMDDSEGNSSFIDDPDDDDGFDEETELNTEQNAEASLLTSATGETALSELFQDLPNDLGEGPNVVLPVPEPFPLKTSTTSPATLPVETSRPEYGRDRCTIKLTQGDPDEMAEKKGHRQRRYVVASDLSEESGYAVEWAIGTVARDGDEIWVVNVCEDEDKVDPKDSSSQDRIEKIRNQKERQTLAQLLSRQVLSLLQRTNLNVDVVCQAVHTKNARHLLLDLIDFLDPTLVIVGSRGLGKLKGTILGSMSHYLVQKSSVPVMIARRRLKRNLKRTDPAVLRQGARVPLARAGIEKTTGGKEQEDIIDAADIEREEDDKDEAGEQQRAANAFGHSAPSSVQEGQEGQT